MGFLSDPDHGKDWLAEHIKNRHISSETGINYSGTWSGQVGVQDWEKKQRENAERRASTASAKVICTELHRQRLFSATDYRLCADDAAKRLTDTHIRGYHFWAVTVVQLMRRSPWITRFFRVLAQARVDEIAARNGESERANVLGKLLIAVGEPACAALGRVCPERKYRTLYRVSPLTK